MTKMAFQPAPRPRPLTSPEEADRLRDATHDLGFGRATAPATAPATAATDTPPHAAALAPAALSRREPSTAIAGNEAAVRKPPALKFDIPDGLWDELRMAALKRRVTVKYLVLEALDAKGYEVDLAAIPEDGRRLR